MSGPVYVLERKFYFRDTLFFFLLTSSATDSPAATFILLGEKVVKALCKLWIEIAARENEKLLKKPQQNGPTLSNSYKPEAVVAQSQAEQGNGNLLLVCGV